MKINFTVPFRRVLTMRTFSVAPTEPQGRAPRIARLLALAHKLDSMVGSGEIRDYAQLARLGHISPARLTQIMVLLHLAPKKPATPQRGGTKTDKVLGLLKQSGGVTLQELVKATGWQPHSVRGFLSGTIGKKMGTPVEPFKGVEGDRCYRLSAK
jgi:hypothetical protein